MNLKNIGMSVVYALTLVLVLVVLWPFLPSSGSFSQVTGTIEEVSDFVIPAIVLGAPAVGYYLLRGM